MCLPYRKICGNYCRSRFGVRDGSKTAFSGRSRNCPSDQHRIRGADLLRITALGRARDLGTKSLHFGLPARGISFASNQP
jgi:hypothetical protein